MSAQRLLFLIYSLTTLAYGDQSITQVFSSISNPSVKMSHIGKNRTPYLFIGHFGQVDILKRINEGNWTLVQTLQGAHESFGQSLGVADYYGTIVVGAPFEENTPSSSTGNIYIYEFINETWVQIANSTDLTWEYFTLKSELKQFGYSVDIKKDNAALNEKYVIAIGAPSDLLNPKNHAKSQLVTLEKRQGSGSDLNKWNCVESLAVDYGILSGLDIVMIGSGNVLIMGKELNAYGKQPWIISQKPYSKSLDGINSDMIAFSDKDMGMIVEHLEGAVLHDIRIKPKKNYFEIGKEMTLNGIDSLYRYVAAVHLKNSAGNADLIVYRIEGKEAFQVFDNYTFNYNRREWLPGKSIDIVVFHENANNTTHRIAVAAYDDLTNSVNVIELSSAKDLQYPWLLGFVLLVTSLL